MKKISWYTPTFQKILMPIFFALITALVYYPSLHYDFQFDDIANISKHFNIRYNTFGNLFFSGTRWVSYWINAIHYSIGKFDPFSYRLGNLLIHIGNGLLVFFVFFLGLSQLKKESFFRQYAYALSCLTSLLFLLHPVQTQTVSYVIQGQLEGLSTLGVMAIILCFLSYTRSNIFWVQFLTSVLIFTLAVLSCGTKEIAIVAPALVFLVDWFFVAQGNKEEIKKHLWLHGMLFSVILSSYLFLLKPHFFTNALGLKIEVSNNIGNIVTHNPADKITALTFFISQFKVILHYLWIFLYPFNISVEYDGKLALDFFSADSIGPFLVLLLIAFAIIRLLKRNNIHMIAFGMIWFAICIAPRATIIPSPELLADYKTYLASVGWLFIVAAALIRLLDFIYNKYHARIPAIGRPITTHIILLACAIPLGWATITRNTVWRSGLEFWANVIKNAPEKARAYNNYGVELSQRFGKFEESIPYFKRAMSMDKNYPDPCNNLAVAYAQLGKIDEAINALHQCLRIQPYYPEGYNNIASFYLQKKDYNQAQDFLQTAIKLRPYYGKAYYNLGRVYAEQNRKNEAFECYKKACTQADLDNEAGFSEFGKISIELKKYDDALFAFKKIIELNPTPNNYFNLANTYYASKNYEQACIIYEKLTKQNPDDYRIWNNAGETYFMLKQYQKALACYEKVKEKGIIIPQIYIRVAACYEQLAQPEQSKAILNELLCKKIDNNNKKIISELLVKLDQKYTSPLMIT